MNVGVQRAKVMAAVHSSEMQLILRYCFLFTSFLLSSIIFEDITSWKLYLFVTVILLVYYLLLVSHFL